MESTQIAKELTVDKRHWLESLDAGYSHTLKPRQIRMIAIGGAIGTGLFLGAGARLQIAGPSLAVVYLVCGIFSFLILRALGELVMHRPSSGSFVSYAREFLGEKASYVAGWMYFLNWAMTGIVDITAVALYMHYWAAFATVPQWMFALVALCIVGGDEHDRREMVRRNGVLVRADQGCRDLAVPGVGAIFLGTGAHRRRPQHGLHLISENGGLFPHGLLPALVLVQGVVFAFAGVELVGTAAGECKDARKVLPRAINSVIWRIAVFYVGSVVLLVCLLPWTAYKAGQSPFVTFFAALGVPGIGTRHEYRRARRRRCRA